MALFCILWLLFLLKARSPARARNILEKPGPARARNISFEAEPGPARGPKLKARLGPKPEKSGPGPTLLHTCKVENELRFFFFKRQNYT